jgi:tetratricopeptide (TPR) repeat protein
MSGESHTAKADADAVIAEANLLHTAGNLSAAAPLYMKAAEGFVSYASFALIAGDSYWSTGDLVAAAAAYRHTIAAVPQHEDAWQNLGTVLMALGDIDDGRHALVRAQAIGAKFDEGEVDTAIDRYWMSHEPLDRATIVNRIASSDEPRVSPVLHDHLERARRYGTAIGELTHWASVATALVRFGVADFLDWYSDGHAPNRAWVLTDVENYLATHEHPPSVVWPVHFTPQPYHSLPQPRPSLWQRLRQR